MQGESRPRGIGETLILRVVPRLAFFTSKVVQGKKLGKVQVLYRLTGQYQQVYRATHVKASIHRTYSYSGGFFYWSDDKPR